MFALKPQAYKLKQRLKTSGPETSSHEREDVACVHVRILLKLLARSSWVPAGLAGVSTPPEAIQGLEGRW